MKEKTSSSALWTKAKEEVFQYCFSILKPLKDWGCYQSQNYKIWKQFTTSLNKIRLCFPLLPITKLQNLKAIHNRALPLLPRVLDVINHKTIKFESNSQHIIKESKSSTCCYQSQNYKIWKQFTTGYIEVSPYILLLSITKL